MSFYRAPMSLQDCARHGAQSGAELFIVEGDSAAKSVASICDTEFQAVLPMQGKPANAVKTRPAVIRRNALFNAVIESLGFEPGETPGADRSRFERVVMLFDPDADGIHCGALMLMFFYQAMRPLLESGVIYLVRAPLYEINVGSAPSVPANSARDENADDAHLMYAYSDEHYRRITSELKAEKIAFKFQRHRGLASMSAATLRRTCLDPATRNLHRLHVEDAEAAIRVFGGVKK